MSHMSIEKSVFPIATKSFPVVLSLKYSTAYANNDDAKLNPTV